ncbi:MAG: TFIIB-type zinc ribbon-containing protein [Halobacteria archaeon]|nr:TFIIB-type zinc ribbon-containing protein [Halobacteria archaeon]
MGETETDDEDGSGGTETESEDVLVCPECGAEAVESERGETVCPDCGLVIEEERVERGKEWRAYSSEEEEEKSRVGAPTTQTMHEKGLTTEISRGDVEKSERRETMRRLRKWHERARAEGTERTLRFGLGEIDRMSSALGVPDGARESAAVILRRAQKDELLPGRSVEAVASAAVYAACRQAGIPRSLDEIADVSRVEKDEITGTYRYLSRQLGLEVPPADPVEFVPRIASELDLSPEVESRAVEILEETAGIGVGKSPKAYAGAAVYLAARLLGEEVTQEKVSDVSDASVVTIRNRYHDQAEALGVDPDLDT